MNLFLHHYINNGGLKSTPSKVLDFVAKYKEYNVTMDSDTYSQVVTYYTRVSNSHLSVFLALGGFDHLQLLTRHVLMGPNNATADEINAALVGMFGDVDNAARYLSSLLMYNELNGAQEMFDLILSRLMATKPSFLESIIYSMISNYLALAREDLALSWFCRSIHILQIAPTRQLCNIFERHYKDGPRSLMPVELYWHNFRRSSQGNHSQTTHPIHHVMGFAKQANDLAVARHPVRGKYMSIRDPADLPSSLDYLAPDTPIIKYIQAIPLEQLLATPNLPSYVKAIALANPYNLFSAVRHGRMELDDLLQLYVNEQAYMFYYPQSAEFTNVIVSCLYKAKEMDLVSRLLSSCLQRKQRISINHVLLTLMLENVDLSTHIKIIMEQGSLYMSNSTEHLFIQAFIDSWHGDHRSALHHYTHCISSTGANYKGALKYIVGAMVWGHSTAIENRNLASFEKFIGFDFSKELPGWQHHLKQYTSALYTLNRIGALGDLPAEYIAALKAGATNRAPIVPELASLLLSSCSSPQEMCDTYKLFHQHQSRIKKLPIEILDVLNAQAFDDPSLAHILDGWVEATTPPKPLSNTSVATILNLIRQDSSIDAVLYEAQQVGGWGRDYLDKIPLIQQREPGQIWINFGFEHKGYFPLAGEKDYLRHMDLRATFEDHSDIRTTFTCSWGVKGVASIEDFRAKPRPFSEKRKSSLLMASNCDRGGATYRTIYVEELVKYTDIKSVGECVKNADLDQEDSLQNIWADVGETMAVKNRAAGKHLFYLAFENNNITDYVSEKLFTAFLAGTVPVYMGAPNIDEYAPENSMIKTSDFASPKELADYLNKLMNDEVAYNRYLEWKTKPFPEWFIDKYNKLIDGGFTFAAWVQPDTLPASFKSKLFTYGNITIGFQLGYKGRINQFYCYKSDCYSGSFNIPQDSWRHIAITVGKGSTKESEIISIYTNGNLDTSFEEISHISVPANTQMYIGCGDGVDAFTGLLDDLVIFARALDGKEIERSMFAKFRGDEPDIHTYATFNDQPNFKDYSFHNSQLVPKNIYIVPIEDKPLDLNVCTVQ
eukprot:gene7414-8673_t